MDASPPGLRLPGLRRPLRTGRTGRGVTTVRGGRGTPRAASLGLLSALVLIVGLLMVPVTASADAGDTGTPGPLHTGTGTPTGTKRAESVLWFNNGSWWGNLWDTTTKDFHIFKYSGGSQTWTDTGVATEPQAATHHDVLWDGTTLFVASHKFVNDGVPAQAGFPSTLRRYSYSASTDKYTLVSTTQINNHKTETLTIDRDSTGRVWATWQQGGQIYLNVTATDGKTWGTPFPAPGGTTGADDLSSLIAFGGNRMGLMWSRQVGDATDGFYWTVHADGAANATWSTPQQIQSGANSGDDHMNLKWLDSSGARVYAAVKTSFTSASQPLIELLMMDGSGNWSTRTIATVSECPNRVIVLIDEAAQRLRTFATYPKPSGTTNAGVCSTSGGAIYEKATSLSNPSFTTAKTVRIVDADQYVHNVSSTKQNLNSSRTSGASTASSGLLVIADVNATSRYWSYADGIDTTDTTPPDTTIDSGPSGSTSATTASFGFSATEPGSTFECRLDTATFTTCTSPRDYTNLTTGPHTFTVRATDPAGNTDPTPATRTWTVDTTAPLTFTPDKDATVREPQPTTNYGTTANLEADTSPSERALLSTTVTGAPTGTVTTATLRLYATNGSGNGPRLQSSSSAWGENAVTWSTQPTPGALVANVGAAPANGWTSYDVSSVVTGNGTYGFTLVPESSDGVVFSSREGAHAPQLVLETTGGSTDTTPPDTTIDSGPSGSTSATTASFGFSATEPGSTFECRLDTATFTTCTSPRDYTNLTTGPHTFTVRATDPAGNTDPTPATRTWTVDTVDTTPPDTTIDSGPSSSTSATTASFGFSATEPGSTFECRLDTATFTTCTSPRDYTNLTTGPHTFTVRATDPAGNTDPTPATRTWTVDTVDTTPPDTTIDSGPSGSTSATTASFGFSATEPGSTFECRLDTATFTTCTSPRDYTNLTTGPHTFTVRATDPAGNTDPTPATRTWTVDTTAPLTFTPDKDATVREPQPTTNYGTTANLEADTSPSERALLSTTVTGAPTGTVTTATLRLYATNGSGNGPRLQSSSSAWGENAVTWSTQPTPGALVANVGAAPANGWTSYDVSSVVTGNGTYGFTLVPESSDGVVFSSREGAHAPQLVLETTGGSTDTTPPDTTIDSGPSGSTSATTASFGFSATEPGSTFECRLDTATFTTCTSPRDYTNLTTGPHTFTVRATDPAGNTDPTPATRTWTVDSTAPRTFTATRDATVREPQPARNDGLDTELVSDTSPLARSLIGFDLGSVAGTVQKAELRLFVTNGTGNGPEVHRVTSPWNETSVTWANQPAVAPAVLEDLGAVPVGTWVTVDVTPAVSTGGAVDFALVPQSSDGLFVSSREAAANRPQLLLTISP